MIDARGYSCPMPVVMVQNEVKKNAPDTLEVLVDSQTCVENVTRFGEKLKTDKNPVLFRLERYRIFCIFCGAG